MDLNHHVGTLAERQRNSRIVRRRRESGSPPTQHSSHRNSRPAETRIASIGACGSLFLSSSARIQINQSVMHNAPVAGTKFNAVQIYIVIQAGWQHEASILIRPIGRQRIFHRDGQHLIRLAALPTVGELRRLRFGVRVALRRTGFRPFLDESDLRIRETAFPSEITVSGLRLPGRHEAAGDRARNQRRSLRGVLVGEQRKGRNLTGAMAGGAVGVKNRRNVFVKGRRRRRLRRSGNANNKIAGKLFHNA